MDLVNRTLSDISERVVGVPIIQVSFGQWLIFSELIVFYYYFYKMETWLITMEIIRLLSSLLKGKKVQFVPLYRVLKNAAINLPPLGYSNCNILFTVELGS